MAEAGTDRLLPRGAGADRAQVVAAIVAALVLMLVALRLRYGVDIIDESYYAAGAHRFALGLHPLVDDLGAHQFASLLMAPFVWVWLSLHGNLDGVILGLRLVYFAGSLLAAVVAYNLLARVVDRPIALVSAACSLCLAHVLIFAPSYDTLSMVGLSLGISTSCIALLGGARPWLFVVSGMAFGVAICAYPTQVVAVVAAIALSGWAARSYKPSLLIAAGVAIAGLPFVAFAWPYFGAVPQFFEYNRYMSAQLGWVAGVPKLLVMARGFVAVTYLAPAAWLSLLVAVFRAARRPVPVTLAVLLPLSLLVVVHVPAPFARITHVSSLLLLAVIASGLGGVRESQRAVLRFAFAVGTTAGLVTAYTGNGGFAAFGVGAAAVGALGIAVLVNNARVALAGRLGEVRSLIGALALTTLLAAGLLGFVWSAAYAERVPAWELASPGAGPYAGLLGSERVVANANSMQTDLNAVSKSGDSLLVYASTPSAYLLSRATPIAPYLWMSTEDGASRPRTEFLLRWVDTPGHRPSVVLVGGEVWRLRHSASRDYLLDWLDARYVPVVSRESYVILRSR